MNGEMKILQQGKDKRPALGFSLGHYLKSLDWVLLAATLALAVYGMFMIYSATHADTNISSPYYYVKSQAVGLVIGLVALIGLSMINYQWFRRYQRYIYVLVLGLLVVTIIIGSVRHGSRRWIDLGFFDLQTSELAKFLLILSFAALLAEGVELRRRFRFVVLAVIYILVPTAFIFIQPDLGTALILVTILFVMLIVWGIRLPHLGILAGAGAFLGVFALRVMPGAFGVHLLKGYQVTRLTEFLNPSPDPSGAGYQLYQSKIAVGSGMFSGKGYLKGTQTHLNFLPAHHTDFIFAVIGEELGFIGCMLLLILFGVVAWRAFRIARLSRDLYGTLIAAGVGGVVIFQVFLNVGMTIGILPVTGVPLPFVSFGSASLIVFLMAIGLLQSVHVHSVAAEFK